MQVANFLQNNSSFKGKKRARRFRNKIKDAFGSDLHCAYTGEAFGIEIATAEHILPYDTFRISKHKLQRRPVNERILVERLNYPNVQANLLVVREDVNKERDRKGFDSWIYSCQNKKLPIVRNIQRYLDLMSTKPAFVEYAVKISHTMNFLMGETLWKVKS